VIVLTTLLITVVSMAFAAQQWWRGHHLMAIGFITFAWLMAGVAIEAAKNNQNAEATEALGSMPSVASPK
jgi:glucose uptake protein GlcU